MNNESFSISDVEAFVSRFYVRPDGTQIKLLITPYAYPTTFLALAQNAVQTNVINIAANADFVLLAIRHRAALTTTQTVSSKVAPFVRVLLQDSGSNENFTNAAVDLENYSTNGNVPHALPYPRIISGRSTITCQVTNFAPLAETYSTLDIMLEGLLVRALQS